MNSQKKMIITCIRQGIRKKIFSLTQKKYYSLGRDLITANFHIRSRFSSRQHCIVACKNKQVFVHDLSSQHGTYVNDYKVKSKASIILHKRDLLVLGSSIKKYFLIKQGLDLRVLDISNKVRYILNSKRCQGFWRREECIKSFLRMFKVKHMKSMKEISFKDSLIPKIILSYNLNFFSMDCNISKAHDETLHKQAPPVSVSPQVRTEEKNSTIYRKVKQSYSSINQIKEKHNDENSKEFYKNQLAVLKEQIKNIDKVVKDVQLNFKTKKIKSKFLGISTHMI